MSQSLIAALQNPALYPHPVERFELIETHISWVLLTGPFESQAVHGLPFFSPSAVALRRGTPEPHPLAFRVGPPAGPVTGRARTWARP